MEFNVKNALPEKQRTACLIIGIYENNILSEAAKQIDDASKGYLTSILQQGDLEGKIGQTLLLHNVPNVMAKRVLLVGCGNEINDSQYRKIINSAMNTLYNSNSVEAVCYLTDLNVAERDMAWKIRQAVELTDAVVYVFDQLKTEKDQHVLNKVAFNASSQRDIAKKACLEAKKIANGIKLTKDLGNLPSNICTPSYMAEQAKDLSKLHTKLSCKILEKARLEKEGLNTMLAVAKGSNEPPKLIILEYKNGDKDAAPVVLVGKGVTFDSGGISIKHSKEMDEMKYDMCGAASVLGVISAVAELKLPINVVGIVPCVENMPSGTATKPGDIVTSLSGQTVEILNTDAEGRLILCDALTYAGRYKPAVVIDIATLTGACVVALGKHASGLLGNDEALIQALLQAGNSSGDRVWQLPLWDDYQEQIDSPFADMGNVGGREGGTITASCFLSRFTKEYQWAHLDIAGTAWLGGKSKGATGRPVSLLLQYLIDRCTKA